MQDFSRSLVEGVTVDAPTSLDLDDAIKVRKTRNSWEIQVSISDVATTVQKGSIEDQHAFQQAFTYYYKNTSKPMLPQVLAHDRLSLLPLQQRNGITVSITLDTALQLTAIKVSRTLFTNILRYSYTDVDMILDNSIHDQHNWWVNCFELALRLFNKRKQKGALAVFDMKKGIATTEDGQVKQLPKGQYRAHLIIQELMILTNELLTKYVWTHGFHLLFRNHTTKKQDVRQQYEDSIQKVLLQPNEKTMEQLNTKVTHLFNRARYSPQCEGHFALNLLAYGHWTSPIRRYADLINHRILHACIDQTTTPYSYKDLQEIAVHLNKESDKNRQVKRDFFRMEYYTKLLGIHPKEISQMEQQDAHHIIKKLTDNSIPLNPEYANGISKRITEDTISFDDIARILFFQDKTQNTFWNSVKKTALEWLQTHPDQAFAIFNKGHSLCNLPTLDQVTFHERTSGFDETLLYHVVAVMSYKNKDYASNLHAAPTKKAAERLAVVNVIESMVSIPENTEEVKIQPKKPTNSPPMANYKIMLERLCVKYQLELPRYQMEVTESWSEDEHSCITSVIYNEVQYSSQPRTGKTEYEAIQQASFDLLEKLSKEVNRGKAKAPPAHDQNPIMAIYEWCQKKKVDMPVFQFTNSETNHLQFFICICSIIVGKHKYEGKGIGTTKKEAKTHAAQATYDKLLHQHFIEIS